MQPMPEYIFNTTALSNFAAVGRLDLLETRYRGAAHITVEVVDELRKGVNAGYTALEPVLQGKVSTPMDGCVSWSLYRQKSIVCAPSSITSST